ncbi:hypothetical protein D770_06950 [Flammeovirgaceae bacterium 311]|nr:hypothetical protein D770_06950 [Flammeovirgaceae bacterium 311]
MTALETVKQYYAAFNKKDYKAMLALVHSDIHHEPNQGETRKGKEKFEEFLLGNDEAYEETLSDMVFFEAESAASRVAVEFTVNGIYKKGDEGFPVARGQKYVLPAAAFLEVKENKISRVSTYYNLPLWIKLVSE